MDTYGNTIQASSNGCNAVSAVGSALPDMYARCHLDMYARCLRASACISVNARPRASAYISGNARLTVLQLICYTSK